jgi:hypothetical protein
MLALEIQGTSSICEQKMYITFVIQPPTDAQVPCQTKGSLPDWSYEQNNDPHFKIGQHFL